MNNRAVTTVQAIIIILIIIVAVVAASFAFSGTPAAASNGPVKVYIDTVEQIGNYSEPQTIDWGTIQAGNTYTKNFTVVNTGSTSTNILLITTEPAGTSQSWAYNNTLLPAYTADIGTLTLTMSTAPTGGAFTWKLLSINGTIPTTQPTNGPTATPAPDTIQFTINADSDIQSIALTKNNAAPYVINTFPAQFTCVSGDDLKLSPTFSSGYMLNGWQFNDGSIPTTTTDLTINNAAANFTVTCTSKYMPTASPIPAA